MSNTPNTSAYGAYGVPIGAYGRSLLPANGRAEGPNRLSRALWIVVALLGPATFAVGLGSAVLLGFPMRFGVFASIVAAVGLLPRQATRGWIVVALAGTGFSDALATWVSRGEPGWALPTVVVLNGLQALAAVGALLRETALGSVASGSAYDNMAYARLAQAYQAYALQYQQPPTPPYDVAAQAAARAQGGATARTRAVRPDAAQESFEELQAKYARHGLTAPTEQFRGSHGERSAPVAGTGVRGERRSTPGSYPYGAQEKSGRSISEPNGP